jgi:C4-type Zn-finger protein
MNKKADGTFLKALIVLLIVLAYIIFSFVGIPIKTTSNGSHTGYVTAIEDNGIIFKGVTVYFKTNAQSSQEDRYCLYVENKELRQQLQNAQESQTKVTITFIDYVMKSQVHCSGEIAIITGVK